MIKPLERSSSKNITEDAQKHFPGGVNSPVRAFGSVGGIPPVISKAKGSKLWDADDNEFIDYVSSWGAIILGHADPDIIAAIINTAQKGTSFGAPTEIENELAQLIKDALPTMELMRFVSSGTEACMSAIRLARGYTERDMIIKFDGCYHGHADSLLVKAGSGVATHAIPGSSGIPEDFAKHTAILPYNDAEAFSDFMARHGDSIACVIIEPFVGNAGFIRPKKSFLQTVRQETEKYGVQLIFDEVMTGFRVGPNSAQGLLGIEPDLTTLGKVVGGGMPLAAFGGKKEIMSKISPLGPVYQAGTLSGNPVAVAAGVAALTKINKIKPYQELNRKTALLTSELTRIAKQFDLPFVADSEGGMFGLFFKEEPVRNFAQAKQSNTDYFKTFFWQMLQQRIYLAPSPFEAGFITAAHSDEDLKQTLEAAKTAMAALADLQH